MTTSNHAPRRYILITQCLQNDFFYNAECRLVLPALIAGGLLLRQPEAAAWASSTTHRSPEPASLERGPLGIFLQKAVRGRRAGPERLYVINIRDWHEPGPGYDLERRSYGPRAEPGTVGAAYLAGLERYLDPESAVGGAALPSAWARFSRGPAVHVYHVHSQSVFDFKPQSGQRDEEIHGVKHVRSHLESLLDVLTMGSEEDLTTLATIADDWDDVSNLADKVSRWSPENPPEPTPGPSLWFLQQ